MINRSVLDRTVAYTNRKGGVLKSTGAANLAWHAALDEGADTRVLVIDLDSQANQSIEFGCRNHPDLGYHPTDEWAAGAKLRNTITTGAPLEPVRGIRERIDLLTADPTWYHDPPESQVDPWDALAGPLSLIAGDYDLIVIDTPPNRWDAAQWALGAARYVILPSRTDDASIDGLPNLYGDILAAQDANPDIELLLLVLSSDEKAKRDTRGAVEKVKKLGFDPDLVCDEIIPYLQTPANFARNSGKLPIEVLAEQGQGHPWWWYKKQGLPVPYRPGDKSLVKLVETNARVASTIMQRIVAHEEAQAAKETLS